MSSCIRLDRAYPLRIGNSRQALIWQAVPFLALAVFITLGWLWPPVGAIALWTLAGLCLTTFAFGIWKQSRRRG